MRACRLTCTSNILLQPAYPSSKSALSAVRLEGSRTPVTPVAVSTPPPLSRISPSRSPAVSAFSFPSSEGPGATSLKAPSFDPICVSDIDERAVPAGCTGGRGGGGGGRAGGGGAEVGGFVAWLMGMVLGCRPLLAMELASEGYPALRLTRISLEC